MNPKGKIAVIIPYFGSWPKWFDLYLLTCSRQEGLMDFFYFTDCGIPEIVYENTFFESISFEKYCDYVSEKLEIGFHPANSYKLTDLKPFLGVVHSDITRKYEFWAFADIDLIYGKMSTFLTERRMASFDLLTTHADRISGHFTAIKVGSKYDNPGFSIDNWQLYLQSQTHSNLDEGAMTNLVYPQLKIVLGIRRRLGKWGEKNHNLISAVAAALFCNRFTARCFIEANTTPVPTWDDVWELRGDSLSSVAGEMNTGIPYLHFLFFKKTPYLVRENYWEPETFYRVTDVHGPVKITLSGIENI